MRGWREVSKIATGIDRKRGHGQDLLQTRRAPRPGECSRKQDDKEQRRHVARLRAF